MLFNSMWCEVEMYNGFVSSYEGSVPANEWITIKSMWGTEEVEFGDLTSIVFDHSSLFGNVYVTLNYIDGTSYEGKEFVDATFMLGREKLSFTDIKTITLSR